MYIRIFYTISQYVYKIGLLDSMSICSIQLKFLSSVKGNVSSGLREAVELTSNTGNNISR